MFNLNETVLTHSQPRRFLVEPTPQVFSRKVVGIMKTSLLRSYITRSTFTENGGAVHGRQLRSFHPAVRSAAHSGERLANLTMQNRNHWFSDRLFWPYVPYYLI